MKDLTVIVPIYNVAPYLERCINSIINQTYVPKKIILVDDGSTDNSENIADKFAAEYEFVSVIHKENGGLSSARNAGLAITETEYVTFVDSDDYLSLDMYEKLFFQLEKHTADISICGVWYESENGKKTTPYKIGINKVFTKIEALKELNSYRFFNMSFCNKIFKTCLFKESAYGENGIIFPVGIVSEDFYIMHKIIARASTIVYISEPLYHYIQRENSISRAKKPNLECLNASVSQVEFYKKWFPDIAYVAESACLFTYMRAYSTHLRRKLICPEEIIDNSKKLAEKYIKSVLKNDVISIKKKIQAIIYRYMFPIYKYIVKLM